MIVTSFIRPSWLICSTLPRHLPRVLRSGEAPLPQALTKRLRWSVAIGTSGSVMMNAPTKDSISVTNVEKTTELRSETSVSGNSRRDAVQLGSPKLSEVTSEMKGTRSLSEMRGIKRKGIDLPDFPSFRRKFGWVQRQNHDILSPAAASTEYAEPLPSPPKSLIDNPEIQSTLRLLNRYIKVETPFNIDRFENLLADHPNQPFVKSVMRGLREGFWPFDDGDWDLDSKDFHENYSTEDQDLEAIRAFRDREIGLGRWSGPLSDSNLYPGMKISPMFVVWQHEKPRVVTDHTKSGLNEGIPKESAHVLYDDMHTFSQALYDAMEENPLQEIVTFKSDIASAFLNLPAHPLWQLRQIVIVDGIGHVVRRLVFGNRGSPRCWCSVSGLICWIGVKMLGIPDLHVYMDDFFGWDFRNDCIVYHNHLRPRRQVQLLILWDFICCPYEDRKQEHGVNLKIIGFWIDSLIGSISLSADSIADIISKINLFLNAKDRQPPLRDWLKLAGHLNWMLNVLPWGRPALSELYRKTAGKLHSHAKIHLNATVVNDLNWLARTIPKSIGIRFVDTGKWDEDDADLVMWTDASGKLGLSFVYAGNGFLYQIKHPKPGFPCVDIFFLELLAILSGIHHVALFASPPKHLLVYTDSLDSVAVLDSLRASESLHNSILLAIAEIMMKSGMDL